MKKIMLLTVVASTYFVVGCSGQQVADATIGVAKVPFKVAGAAVTAGATVAGTVAGTAAGGPVGGMAGGAIAGAVVGAIMP